MGVFKAYDIRGIYGKEFNKEDVYKIGFFLPSLLKADKVLVGRDVRASSPEIFEYLTRGITDAGADVYDLGLCTTPMVYFCTAFYEFPASVQITASHNPKEYNGLKISKTGALPVGYETGLAELEGLVKTGTPSPSAKKGSIIKKDARRDYMDFLGRYKTAYSLNLAIDCSNGMAALFAKELFGDSPYYLFDTLDGTFPNHEPNPLEEENVEALKVLVREKSCDLGIIFDGDADRVMFVDNKARFVSPDLIIGVLAKYYLDKEKGAVLFDIRTSRSVSEYIIKLGGTPHMWKVGHAFAKVKMREINAVVGGELAGHYYFRDFFFCDSGILAALLVLSVADKLKKEGVSFSDLIDSLVLYAFSGERNFRIEKKNEAMEELKSLFTEKEKPKAFYDFDGYRIEFEDWWFNVRPSNTEPYLRLVVEAGTQELLKEKLDQLTKILSGY